MDRFAICLDCLRRWTRKNVTLKVIVKAFVEKYVDMQKRAILEKQACRAHCLMYNAVLTGQIED